MANRKLVKVAAGLYRTATNGMTATLFPFPTFGERREDAKANPWLVKISLSIGGGTYQQRFRTLAEVRAFLNG